jgi:pimeloyl-ACP methyl ester carboxylesterase
MRVNGVDLYYEEIGQGPALLLLHRYGACGAIWQPHRERLGEHRRLIIPDLPGHGRSTNPDGPFRHSQAARDLFALLDSLDIDEIEAMGISSGGMTLLHMATQQPERISTMVLIGATTHFGPEARAIMSRSTPERLSREEWAGWAACSARGDQQTLQLLRDFHEFKDDYVDMSFTPPHLGTITARTLIVHGDRDEFFPVGIPMQMYRSIPRSSLWVVPGGGHIPIFGERAGQFQDEALRFLLAGG